jgi:Icc-related predicted phosphoesterase
MPIRFIITADLHQDMRKWEQLVGVVQQDKPRFVLVAGDLLPKQGGFHGQRKFFPVLADYLAAMRGTGQISILTFFGNDDFHPLEPLLDELAATGLCVNLNGKVHREDGFVFCGMAHVPVLRRGPDRGRRRPLGQAGESPGIPAGQTEPGPAA